MQIFKTREQQASYERSTEIYAARALGYPLYFLSSGEHIRGLYSAIVRTGLWRAQWRTLWRVPRAAQREITPQMRARKGCEARAAGLWRRG